LTVQEILDEEHAPPPTGAVLKLRRERRGDSFAAAGAAD
jgi:hypothetical protein